MDKKIIGFHIDDEDDWVADLACGHTQHVRHNPPWTNRPWVLKEETRKPFLGTHLDCLKCNMPKMPANVYLVGSVECLDQQSLVEQYAGMQCNDKGWIQIIVTEGELVYQLVTDKLTGYVIDADLSAVVAPDSKFFLKPKGDVLFSLYRYQVVT